ncbi:hypothetical protein Gbro_2495 [Gordonia bronchialis DSM 43247]|uniref:DUF385 domain-containing protein n=1 Tax=Gordonia bronchialis (strain ATCC 25592 / DSM 43247 / BCRC 13721 / JCM 3198 / KCTC 3076 / NBRC 16047 / NCTC 10667) TaxID=526226 RepID=D0LDW3_GORB4|nr:nitroreductase/quinone reductase family protein [Gordonia bronchialis]ACY21736.1 hypothetical protein Gbro_2495 [Gordonia bronchialis DSM 43247]MCC3324522.1 nitroreductase family deazaflavin-dependent oxidoreductase [Gordonia bronchialis]QGS24654.1 DUF385 domain-containing protein [Gordonia bronchialis]STQ64624.1 Domain of uncharacterised function (DUF385) [Gordonia bronchialis]
MTLFQHIARVNNAITLPILRLPVIRDLAARSITVLTYTGRKSGKSVRVPVAYRRSGDEVTVGVAMADRKTWWRNFTGAGAPVALTLDGRERTGHAVSGRDEKGQVTVRITLAG